MKTKLMNWLVLLLTAGFMLAVACKGDDGAVALPDRKANRELLVLKALRETKAIKALRETKAIKAKRGMPM